MKKFLKFFFFLSLFKAYLHGTVCAEKTAITGLINQTIESERYWTQLSYTPFNRALERPISSWLTSSWSTEIQEHLEALKVLRRTLAETLAALETDGNKHTTLFQETCANAQKVLAYHAKPSHISRHWITYTCLTAAAIAATIKTKQFFENTNLFEFQSTSEEWQAIYNRLAEKNTIQFDAIQYCGKNYIKAPSNDQWHVQEALNHVLKDPKAYTQTSLSIADLSLYFYNEQGENRLKLFFDKSLIDPLKNIYWKVFKEPVKKSILTCNTDNYAQDLKNILTQVAQDALEQKDYDNLFTPFEIASRKLAPNKSIDELQAIHYGILYIAEFNLAHNIGRAIAGRKVALASAILALLKETSMQKAELMSDVAMMIEKQNIVIELVAMMPGALLTYLGYKATSSTLKNRHKKLVLNPLAQDLRDFEILLDEYHDAHELDVYFYGMRLYWINQLESYLDAIATEQRSNFDHDIKRLKNKNLSVQHQLSIVTALLRYGLQNF